MWRRIFPDDQHMVWIDGMTGQQSLKKLNKFKKQAIIRKVELESLNPENGNGSYEGFMAFIDKLIKEARRNPRLIWLSWR